MCKIYGIRGINEAKAYLADEYLRNHLEEICHALLQLPTNDASTIMSDIDVRKLQSSMTLFTLASSKDSIYQAVLDKYYHSKLDAKTIRILESH